MKEKLIVALDVSSREEALNLVKQLHELAGMFKVGSQLYMAAGPSVIGDIAAAGGRIFLDLKFHDIPNTVARSAVEAARLGVSMLTIHSTGGRKMMESTVDALRETFGDKKPTVVAVTVLTSLDTRTLFEIGLEQPVDEQVQRLARLAEECGIDGVVCSPREVTLLRMTVRQDFKIVVPGIRMSDQSAHDQQRTSTPKEAISAGADYIVVGRAVTGEPDPRLAMERLIQSL